jgi:hypothetical protein
MVKGRGVCQIGPGAGHTVFCCAWSQHGCGRGLQRPASSHIPQLPPSFTRLTTTPNRTDAAITYTYSLTSFVVVRKLSVASSSTTPSIHPPLLRLPPSAASLIIDAFHSFLLQPPYARTHALLSRQQQQQQHHLLSLAHSSTPHHVTIRLSACPSI